MKMRYLIASDIHGSAYWCRKMIEVFHTSGAEKMILLGDLLYHGPRNDLPEEYDPKTVTALLNAEKKNILAVRGNCDSEVDQMVLQFPIMADYAWMRLNDINFFVTHGHLFNDEEQEKMPLLNSGDVLLHGHIHLPVAEKKAFEGGVYYLMNPGSTSIPKGGNPSSYAVLDGNTYTIFDFDGNIIKELTL